LSFAVGERFGRYEIEGTLGEGGMGTVYRATDTRLGRRVALKVVRADRATDLATRAKAATALVQEARAAATLEHVNAVSIYDVGQEGDTTFIAMELVSGRSLRACISDGSVPMATRVRWVRDVARVLDAAHARGLVHRDVKPENVMVREDGTIKVLDFGIAWVRGDAAPPATGAHRREEIVESWRSTFTRDGVFIGTPRYMSPEQIAGAPIDGRSDQFSWGVLAYELLAQRPPWLGETASLGTALFEIVEAEPPPLRTVAPDVPAGVEQVVSRTLRKRPEERFASMHDVVEALDLSLEGGRARRRWVAPTAGAVGLVGVALALKLTLPRVAHEPMHPSGASPAVATSTAMTRFETAPHVLLFLDAAKGVALKEGAVSRWSDQSGLGNDAVAGSLAPTFVESAIHGLPAVHFDGGQHMVVADALSLQIGKLDFTVEVVARHTRPLPRGIADGYSVATSYGMLYGKVELPEPFTGIALFVNHPHPIPSTRFGVQTSWNDNVATTSDGLNDGRPHLFGARREGTSLEVRLDGVEEARIVVPVADVSAVGRPVFLGANPGPRGIVQQLQGDIAELIVISGPIGPRTFAELEADLKTKFGL
jgi:tRNA A-37 threonylcarbamoyl transferase component Bud32